MWKKGNELIIKETNEKCWTYTIIAMLGVMIIALLKDTQDRSTDVIVGFGICLLLLGIAYLWTKSKKLHSIVISGKGFQYDGTLLEWDKIDYVYHFQRYRGGRYFLTVKYHDEKGEKKELEIDLENFRNLFTSYYAKDIKNAVNYFSGREICNASR
ncbi:MAG: hypothetical protein J5554_14235 [Paludibacteraceae bacterium]|nr:hypothetical protein [Paludibacteraceae bacterium]